MVAFYLDIKVATHDCMVKASLKPSFDCDVYRL
jgi:hypothetical protein